MDFSQSLMAPPPPFPFSTDLSLPPIFFLAPPPLMISVCSFFFFVFSSPTSHLSLPRVFFLFSFVGFFLVKETGQLEKNKTFSSQGNLPTRKKMKTQYHRFGVKSVGPRPSEIMWLFAPARYSSCVLHAQETWLTMIQFAWQVELAVISGYLPFSVLYGKLW